MSLTKRLYWNPSVLRRMCEATSISRATLAKGIGISISSLNNYVYGKAEPGIDSLIKISEFFCVPIDFVIGHASTDVVDAVLSDYGKNFMQLRRASYEAYISLHEVESPSTILHKTPAGKYVEAPWPYNLTDSVFCEPVEMILTEDHIAGIEKAISTLTEKEQTVIHKRFEEGLSLDEVGEIFGLSRERIRQIEAKAVRKLRHPSRMQYIKYGKEGKKLDDDLRRREKEIIERERKLAVKEEQLTDALNTLSLIKDAYAAVEEPEAPETNLCDKMKIGSLELTVRSYNCLKRANINTIGDLARCAESGGLNHIRNLGRISVKEILTKLFAFGYDYYDVYENPKHAS